MPFADGRAGYIPSSVMIPQRRFATLLDQARAYQQSLCLYHNAPMNSRTFSLYTDHLCDKHAFPRVTTAILEVHTDEVWNLEWSHSGNYLASASKDMTAIIWRVEVSRVDLLSRAFRGRAVHTRIHVDLADSMTKIPQYETYRRSLYSATIHSL